MKEKRFICFVDMKKYFDRIQRRANDFVMRKKEIPEIVFIAVKSLHDGS